MRFAVRDWCSGQCAAAGISLAAALLFTWFGSPAAHAQGRNPFLRAPAALPGAQEPALVSRPYSAEAQAFFQQSGGDLRDAIGTLAAGGGAKRGMLVVFTWPQCEFSEAMNESIYPVREIREYFHSRMRVVRIDVTSDLPVSGFDGQRQTQKEFAIAMGVTTTPTFLFFDTGGTLRYRHRGAITSVRNFYTFGRHMADGIWDRSVVDAAISAR